MCVDAVDFAVVYSLEMTGNGCACEAVYFTTHERAEVRWEALG
jgi:hypothetical protein